jgi:hypothetical protein
MVPESQLTEEPGILSVLLMDVSLHSLHLGVGKGRGEGGRGGGGRGGGREEGEGMQREYYSRYTMGYFTEQGR